MGKSSWGVKGALIGEWCGVEFGVDRVGPACPDCGREEIRTGLEGTKYPSWDTVRFQGVWNSLPVVQDRRGVLVLVASVHLVGR